MKHTKEILLSICVILFLTVCLAFFWAKKNNNLPQMALPELQKGIVYDVSLNSSDIPPVTENGMLRFYRIPLDAGQRYRFESHVEWDEITAVLFIDGKKVDDMNCGYNATCHFSVEPEKDSWGILKIVGAINHDKQPVSIEVRPIKSVFNPGSSSLRRENLPPSSIPIINTDVVYHGEVSAADLPLYNSGEGRRQYYQVKLNAGQDVLIRAKSSGLDIGVILKNVYHQFKEKYSTEDSYEVCFHVNIPKDGLYTIPVITRDITGLDKGISGKYTLEVSTLTKDRKPCPAPAY